MVRDLANRFEIMIANNIKRKMIVLKFGDAIFNEGDT